jgi:hypothetical protein
MPVLNKTRQRGFLQILSVKNGGFMRGLTKRGGFDSLLAVAA